MKRLDELARRYALPPAGVAALEAILELQAADPAASTTVREPSQAVDRHVADSLVALELPAVRAARRIADLGAGAGWPGLALAASLPAARVALVESAIRHCRYLERAVAAAGLANVEVVHARAEDWPAGIGAHDVVTARALASLPVLCEYAAPLLGRRRGAGGVEGARRAGRGRGRRRPRRRSSGSSRPRSAPSTRTPRPSAGRCTSSGR